MKELASEAGEILTTPTEILDVTDDILDVSPIQGTIDGIVVGPVLDGVTKGMQNYLQASITCQDSADITGERVSNALENALRGEYITVDPSITFRQGEQYIARLKDNGSLIIQLRQKDKHADHPVEQTRAPQEPVSQGKYLSTSQVSYLLVWLYKYKDGILTAEQARNLHDRVYRDEYSPSPSIVFLTKSLISRGSKTIWESFLGDVFRPRQDTVFSREQ